MGEINLASTSNYSLQNTVNYGTINTEFHCPPERPETPPQPFASIPFCHDPDFVNREDILDQMDRRYSVPAGRVALVGLGGVGKSQLAIEFAHQIVEAQGNIWIFWIHAGKRARVEEGFRTIADTVKLAGRNRPKADIPLLVQNWLSNERNGRWIMILDSADDYEVFYGASEAGRDRPLATYLPQSRNSSIIITTHDKDLVSRLTGNRENMIEIGPMVQTDALTLLRKKLGLLSDVAAVDLVEALDRVPLTISQAAAYIQARAPRSSVEKYLAEFQKNDHKKTSLLQLDAGGDLRRDGAASNAVMTTWQISFDHIRSRRASTADLLSFMSFFDRQAIPDWVLKPHTKQGGGLNETKDQESEGSDDNSDSDADSDNDSDFETDLAMLRDYCLVSVNNKGNEFEMHRLVQLSTRR
ncbi:uncharacterized protein DNG_05152 [Cephalotrichum gorgonifer]|uniref:NB-ARC domain-containing protein n=1 Tax=Cephalotrichum gorgonifer TaxID=2041049 RepID=A0AAE8MZ73_9PEZI|nr:uncharacterized protein DNG_05152 [Cephalotrichum gorgonifer]